MSKPKENQLGILGISARKFTYFAGNSAEQRTSGPHVRELQLYLVVQGRAQVEHSSHVVKVRVEATC